VKVNAYFTRLFSLSQSAKVTRQLACVICLSSAFLPRLRFFRLIFPPFDVLVRGTLFLFYSFLGMKIRPRNSQTPSSRCSSSFLEVKLPPAATRPLFIPPFFFGFAFFFFSRCSRFVPRPFLRRQRYLPLPLSSNPSSRVSLPGTFCPCQLPVRSQTFRFPLPPRFVRALCAFFSPEHANDATPSPALTPPFFRPLSALLLFIAPADLMVIFFILLHRPFSHEPYAFSVSDLRVNSPHDPFLPSCVSQQPFPFP